MAYLTGLTALVVAGLFLLCLVLEPLAQSFPAYASAATFLFVAVTMARSPADVDGLYSNLPPVRGIGTHL